MNLGGSWPIRIAWLIQPFALGPSVGAGLDGHSGGVQVLIAVAAWFVWTAGVVAVLVPRTVGLTLLRIAAPAALALAAWGATGDTEIPSAVVAIVAATIATVVALAPTTGDAFVNGSAYGSERRFALRAPAALLFGPVQLVWVLVVAGLATGPLLLATGQWIWGAVATVVGALVMAWGVRSLHQLSRRWLVMVPAGVVLHDPSAVTSQLFRRSTIASIGPAPADTGALDLTAGALGLALEIQLDEAVTIEQIRFGRGRPRVVHATAVLFTPTRPGAVLQEAAIRRIRVNRSAPDQAGRPPEDAGGDQSNRE